MQFNSLYYIAFLFASLLIYYLLPHRFRKYFLLAASYAFYVICMKEYAVFLLAATLFTYAAGICIGRRLLGKRRLWLVLSLCCEFGLLLFFKYSGFLERFFDALSRRFGLGAFELPPVVLPVGISFFTFVVCGYLIDVYRGKSGYERNLADYALFVSFFPAILAGPIERSTNLLVQIKQKHPLRVQNLREGFTLFLWGLFKKMVIADNIAIAVNTFYSSPEDFTGIQAIFAVFAYSVQIYCDFSSYSEMAIGSAKMLGFELTTNFERPYLAESVKGFWRRWHISLSSWFRDYLYFPLGGSRRTRARTYFNVMVVFAVSGIWHGDTLSFLVWGLLNGVYQVAGALLEPIRSRLRRLLHISDSGLFRRIYSGVFTFLLITATWVFFRAGSLQSALGVLKKIAMIPVGRLYPFDITLLGLDRASLLVCAVAILLLFAVDLISERRDLAGRLNGTVWIRYGVYFALLASILVFGAYGSGYDPQEFVYFKF